MNFKILVINPGSTSTRIAIFHSDQPYRQETIHHSVSELIQFKRIWDQKDFRLKTIQQFLATNNITLTDFSAIVGRGGLLRPLIGGTYKVNETMLADMQKGLQGEHAANLACVLAYQLAHAVQIPAFVVDPVSVDELEPLARYSGHPLIQRRSLSHALNIHAIGREVAHRLGFPLEETRFIIAHLGGGISVCPLKGGRIIDVNDASGDGPFSPERTGGLPLQQFINLCFSGQYSADEIRRLVMGEGGLLAYLKTNDAQQLEDRIKKGDKQAEEIYQAMAYQIAKEIGAMSTVLSGRVQAIILNGGLANSQILTNWIKERVQFIAEVIILQGEFEMQALANGALRALSGEEPALTY